MRIKLFSTEIYVSFLFAAVIALMLLIDRTGLVIPTLFAVLIHETGHLFAMWVADCAPKSVRLIPTSVQIVRKFSPRPHGESAIALCGPLANLAVFLTFFLHFLVFRGETVLRFALLNLILGAFNLLPVKGLDGGTLLVHLLCRKTDAYRAEKAVRVLTLIFAAAFGALGIFLALDHRLNPSVFLIAIYFLITALMKR